MATGAVGLVGVGLFVWVILGDLSPRIEAVYELPDPAMAIGPLLFLVGLAGPLASLAWATPRLVPRAAPIAVVLAFAALAAKLDLLAPAALLFGYALWCVVGARRPSSGAHSRR